jgi:hypothetical protein
MKMNTREKIASMLKENTGSHFLDSGGAYGRHWEHNQVRDFDQENPVSLDFNGFIDYTKNLYHFLTDNLEYNPDSELNQYWEELKEVKEYKDYHWLQLMELFPEWLHDNHDIDLSGLYGEGEPFTYNTYNYDCNLSQVIQFLYFSYDGIDYVLLQIHNGCDVRGGYTRPELFEVTQESFLMFSDGYIVCPDCGLSWWSDDSYNWYLDHGPEELNTDPLELDDYNIQSIEDYIQDNDLAMSETEFIHRLKLGSIHQVARVENQLNLIPDVPKPIKWEINDQLTIPDNVLWTDQHNQGLCPNCFTPLTA